MQAPVRYHAAIAAPAGAGRFLAASARGLLVAGLLLLSLSVLLSLRDAVLSPHAAALSAYPAPWRDGRQPPRAAGVDAAWSSYPGPSRPLPTPTPVLDRPPGPPGPRWREPQPPGPRWRAPQPQGPQFTTFSGGTRP